MAASARPTPVLRTVVGDCHGDEAAHGLEDVAAARRHLLETASEEGEHRHTPTLTLVWNGHMNPVISSSSSTDPRPQRPRSGATEAEVRAASRGRWMLWVHAADLTVARVVDTPTESTGDRHPQLVGLWSDTPL